LAANPSRQVTGSLENTIHWWGQGGDVSDRITDLEVKVAFLEASVQEYDQLIQELFSKLNAMSGDIKRLDENQKTSAEGYSIQDEKPPHY
jgi:uncharacterized coiled-coil protein SlyX